MAGNGASIEARQADGELRIICSGKWTIGSLGALNPQIAGIRPAGVRAVRFDLAGVEAIDSAGGWLISRTQGALKAAGMDVAIEGADPG